MKGRKNFLERPFAKLKRPFVRAFARDCLSALYRRWISPSFQFGKTRNKYPYFAVSLHSYQDLISLLNQSAKVISFPFPAMRRKKKISSKKEETPSCSDNGIIWRDFVQKGICIVFVGNHVCGKTVGYHQIRSLECVIIGSNLVNGFLSELYVFSFTLHEHKRL